MITSISGGFLRLCKYARSARRQREKKKKKKKMECLHGDGSAIHSIAIFWLLD